MSATYYATIASPLRISLSRDGVTIGHIDRFPGGWQATSCAGQPQRRCTKGEPTAAVAAFKRWGNEAAGAVERTQQNHRVIA